MSIDLGSARGQLILDSSGVSRGVSAAVRALRDLDARATGSGKGLEQIEQAGSRMGAGVARGAQVATRGVTELQRSTVDVGAALDRLGNGATVFGGVLAAGLGGAVKFAGDFESTMSDVKATSGATADEMARLGALAKQLGADTTFSANEAAQGIAELQRAGLSTSQVLGGALKGALDLAAAGGLEVGQAAEIAAKALNIFGLDGGQAAHVADLFAAGANKSATSVQGMAQAFNQSAAVADGMGISIEELTGALALFAQRGLEGSDAGTSLKTALIALTNPSKEAAEVMSRLGIDAYDARGNFVGLAALAEDLQTSLSGLTQEQRNAALATIFGSDAIRVASALYEAGGKGVREWTAAVNDTGAASRVAATRMDNLKGSVEQLKGSAETLAIAVGTQALPALNGVVERTTDLVDGFNDLDPAVQRIAVTAAAGAAGFLLLGGSVIKTAGYLRELKGITDTVIGAFGRKEAAKKTLTAANQTLAGSAGKTSIAFGAVRAAATTAAPAIAAATAVTAAGVGVWGLQIAALAKYNEATGGVERAQQGIISTRAALSIAAQNGAAADSAHAEAYLRLVQAQHQTITNTDQLIDIWNRYVTTGAAAVGNTAGLTVALTSQQQAQLAVNRVLGEGLIAGSQFNDTIGVMAGAARSLAATLPPVGGSFSAAALAAGELATPVRLSALALQDINSYGTSAQTRLNELASGALALALEAKGLGGELGRLGTTFALTNEQMGQVGSEQAQVVGWLRTLQAEWDELDRVTENGAKTTEAQKRRYAELAPLIEYLNGRSGELSATTVDLTERQVAQYQAIQRAASAFAEGGAKATGAQVAVGLLGAATKSAGENADTAAGGARNQAGAIDEAAAAAVKAAGTIAGLGIAINALPKSFTITANVDISQALANIDTLRANTPSSPADEGPFKTLPNWHAIFESLAPAGEDAVLAVRATTLEMARSIGAGLDAVTDESAERAAELASRVAGAVSATADALARLHTFRAPDPGRFGDLRGAFLPIIDAFADDGAARGDAGKAAAEWAERAGAVAAAVSSGADALAKLRGFTRPADEALAAFRDSSRHLIDLMLEIAASADRELVDAGATWAEGAGAIYTSVGTGVDALAKLGDFRRPTDRAVNDFRDVSQLLVNVIAQVAADIDDRALPKAQDWGETAGAIFGALGSGVDALVKLDGFARPADQAVESFRDVAQHTVNLLAQVAADIEAEALPGARDWSEAAQAIFGALASGVEALAKLHDFARPADQAVQDFRDVSQLAVNVIAQVAADIEADALPRAGEWSQAAAAIFGALSSGVDALTKLHEFARPTDEAVRSFRDVAQLAVGLFAQVAADMEARALPQAEGWAKAADAIFGAIGSGVEALTGLDDFERPTDEALRSFRDVSQQAVNLIVEIAATTDAEAVAAAATYAEASGKVLGLIGSGVGNLAKLGEGEFRPPDRATLERVAQSSRDAVLAIGAAARSIETELVEEAATYSDGAGKAVALLGAGFAAFSDIGGFVPPSQAQIDGVVAVTARTIQQLAAAAARMDQEAVKAAGQYGQSGASAIGVVGATLGAFRDLDKFVAPSAKAIDGVIGVAQYATDRLIGVAQGYDPTALERLGDFGGNVGAALAALKGALDLGGIFGDKDRVKPADAIGMALVEFQAGVAPLDELVLLSEQYASKAAQIEANMAQTYASIAASLPGYYPEWAAATTQLTMGAQQTIVHRYEGKAEIQFTMMAENGQWIVRSLQIDRAASEAVAEDVAGWLLEAFPSDHGL